MVALAAAGAGVGRAHEAGGELVGEVAAEDSILDEDGLLGGVALVVDVERAAAVGHLSVVDDGDFFAGDFLADKTGEGGGLLAVEVGFEAVADGFVQQDAGPSGAEDDWHLASGGCDGVELQDGGAGGLAGEVLGRFCAFKEVERDAASAAGLVPRVVLPAPWLAEASLAMTKTLRRARGWVSEAKVPSDAAMRMRRSSSLKPTRTCVMRGSKSRAARSARWMRSNLAAISASAAAPAIG